MNIQVKLSVEEIKATYPEHFDVYERLCKTFLQPLTKERLQCVTGIVSIQLVDDDLWIQTSPKTEGENAYVNRIMSETKAKIRFEIVPSPTVFKCGVEVVPLNFVEALMGHLKSVYNNRLEKLKAEEEANKPKASVLRNREQSLDAMRVLDHPVIGQLVEYEGRKYVAAYGPMLAESIDGTVYPAMLCLPVETVRSQGIKAVSIALKFSAFNGRPSNGFAIYVSMDGKRKEPL